MINRRYNDSAITQWEILNWRDLWMCERKGVVGWFVRPDRVWEEWTLCPWLRFKEFLNLSPHLVAPLHITIIQVPNSILFASCQVARLSSGEWVSGRKVKLAINILSIISAGELSYIHLVQSVICTLAFGYVCIRPITNRYPFGHTTWIIQIEL